MQAIMDKKSSLMKAMVWLSDMVHIQFLWVVFTLAGLVVGGIFPATYAMFAVQRRLIRKKSSGQLNKLFWEEYKANFIKANILGLLFVLIVLGVYLYYQSVLNITGPLRVIFSFVAFGIVFFTTLTIVFTGPVAAHFDLDVFQIIKHALIVEVSCPIHTIGIIATTVAFIASVYQFPVLVPFVSVAIFTYSVMWIAQHAFGTLEKVMQQS